MDAAPDPRRPIQTDLSASLRLVVGDANLDRSLRGAACLGLGALLTLVDDDEVPELAADLARALAAGVVDPETKRLLEQILARGPIVEPASALELREAFATALRRVLAGTPSRPTTDVDHEFGDGVGPFRFGMSPVEVNALLPTRFGRVSWESLPVAREFAPADVRYFWVGQRNIGDHFSGFVPSRMQPVSASSYFTFLFRGERLIRISLRYLNGPDCGDHRDVLAAFATSRGWCEATDAEGLRVARCGRRVRFLGASSPRCGSVLELWNSAEVTPQPASFLDML